VALHDIPLMPGARLLNGHGPEVAEDRLEFLNRIAREVDGVGRFRVPLRDLVVVNSPQTVHQVLVSESKAFEKSPLIRMALDPLAGQGLFTSEGALWRRQRRLMAPVFHHAKIDALAPAMVECAQLVCEGWRDGALLDAAHETTRITMAVAGRTLFGFDTFDESDELGQALTVALGWADYATRRLSTAFQVELLVLLSAATGAPAALRPKLEALVTWLRSPILWPTHRNRELREAIALLDARVQRMIDERRAASAPNEDLLTHLLRARDQDDGGVMDDKQVRDEIVTLFVAGHETTANGLAWAIDLLVRHPAVYAEARACVDALGGRAPTLGDLERLDLLTRVFKEALRLYPPVYLFARMSTTDVTIGGYALPKHTVVLISPWALHRRADLWPDPTRFDPERFTAPAEAARPRDAWIPFSDGPRVCIGMHFALIEAPLVLATLLQRADFELATSAVVAPADDAATLRPRGGVPVRIRRRDPIAATG
jgi:cytochrome P450